MGARQKLTAISMVVLLLVPGFSVAASAQTDSVVFEGSGWGHGVGLSQYGALAMAVKGRSYTQILAHYYRGTSIDLLSTSRNIWVNVEEKFTSRTLKVLNLDPHKQGAPVQVKLDSTVILAQPGATIKMSSSGNSGGCVAEVTNPDDSVEMITDPSDCSIDLWWYGWDSGANPSTKLLIQGCLQPDWNVSPTNSVPCQYARGQMHLRGGAGGLFLSAEMRMDDYVVGISEVPFNWAIEAQKAQAVAARSYARARSLARGVPSSTDNNGCWCQVRDTTSDQRYVGWGHSNRTNWINATNATSRRVLTHPDSTLGVITAYYSSSSGGRTEYGHLRGFSTQPVEWLTSVDDSHAVDGTVPNPNASWTKSVNATTVAAAAGLDVLGSMVVSANRSGSGSVAEVKLVGVKSGQSVTIRKSGTWVRTTFGLRSEYFDVDYTNPGSLLHPPGDELLFYRSNGEFRYNSLHATGILGAPIRTGSNYTHNWKAIASIDLDGDGQDEIFFYRDDGLYRYYEIGSNGAVGSPIRAGDEYTHGWDSVVAIDLDGDGQDEVFFYRDDGLYRFYDIRPDGRIGSPIAAGDEYTRGWDSITAVDLDGDGQDEMFFYREDGLYRYYDVGSDGGIGKPIRAGEEYTRNWTAITAADLEGDDQDEMFFYRDDGLFRFYDIRSDASLGTPIRSGSNFETSWSIIATINLDGE